MKFCVFKKVLNIPIDHSDDNRVEDAKIVIEHWKEHYDYALCTKFANSYGMNSVYHPGGILLRASWGESADMILYAIAVGGVSFVFAPFEMYSDNGSYIKYNSPFDLTFVVTSCNTLHRYLAEDRMLDIGSYEVDTRRYPRGTAEKVADAFVSMLTQMHK